ncbi:MAG: BolA family protein [Rhodospirillaceae bacterium]
MSVQAEIERKIREALQPDFLDVVNESHMHNVPPGSESHFKVIVVSPAFDNLGRVQRHQRVNGILADELAGPVHALSMETHTEAEWVARGGKRLESPLCHGGSKADA